MRLAIHHEELGAAEQYGLIRPHLWRTSSSQSQRLLSTARVECLIFLSVVQLKHFFNEHAVSLAAEPLMLCKLLSIVCAVAIAARAHQLSAAPAPHVSRKTSTVAQLFPAARDPQDVQDGVGDEQREQSGRRVERTMLRLLIVLMTTARRLRDEDPSKERQEHATAAKSRQVAWSSLDGLT